MKLGIYLQTWHVGGIAAFCERLAVGLSAAGDSVWLILATPYGKRDAAGRKAYEQLVTGGGLRIGCLHLNAFHPRERPWRAADRIAGLKLDALLLNSPRAILDALPRLSAGLALIGIGHTDDDDTYADFCAAKGHCRAYAGVSETVTRTLESLRGAALELIVRQIPCGVPFESGSPIITPSGEPRILVVSRLVQLQKRVGDLPAIWQAYIAGGGRGRLTVCGSGEEEERLRAAFAPEIAAGRVSLTGAVPLARMREVYAEHDILLSVSAYEGLPISVLEAASAGLYPVLSRTRSGHQEIVDHLGEGRLCPPGDIDSFCAALREASSSIARLRVLRPILSARTLARFSLDEMISSYTRLAREAIQARQSGPVPSSEPASYPRPKADPIRRLIRRWQYCRHYDLRSQPIMAAQ